MLKCSDGCDDSKENPLFNVSVIVSEDRSIAYDIHEKDPRDFNCVHCDSVAKEGKEEGLKSLFEAMGEHGNCSGTEYQLGDAEELLREAWRLMSDEQHRLLLKCYTAKELMESYGKESDEEVEGI